MEGFVVSMKYQQSHPWLTFSFKAELSDYRFWLQLGEVSSKCEHLSGVPLRPEFAAELHRIFLAKGILATTAIEGNTLSEEQVLESLDGKLELPPSQDYLRQEVENILRVCNREIEGHLNNRIENPKLSSKLIESYNREILANLRVEEGVAPGQLRRNSVVVGRVYRGAPAEDCEYLLDQLCRWITGPDFAAPSKDLEVSFALIKAVIAHVYLAWIHPFGDGNGRTARLVEFHLLFSSGIPLPAAHLLSDHYNKTRSHYYQELDRASKSGGDLMPFLRYALQGFLDGLRDQIERVKKHQMEVAWENYVHQCFSQNKSTTTQKRRRDLVLELSRYGLIPSKEIELLTPQLAQLYAVAGDRMLQRDLNALCQLKLIERRGRKVQARKSIIQAFLPARVKPSANEDANAKF
jgi:Fic family protein